MLAVAVMNAVLRRRTGVQFTDCDGGMSKHSQFPTPIQNIALSLSFAVMGESRHNRTYSEYMAVADRLPPLKILFFKVNEFLRHLHECDGCDGLRLPELCRFQSGDERVTYEPFPKSISYETIRSALTIAGLHEQRWRKEPSAQNL
jgi:hypothetical protein